MCANKDGMLLQSWFACVANTTDCNTQCLDTQSCVAYSTKISSNECNIGESACYIHLENPPPNFVVFGWTFLQGSTVIKDDITTTVTKFENIQCNIVIYQESDARLIDENTSSSNENIGSSTIIGLAMVVLSAY